MVNFTIRNIDNIQDYIDIAEQNGGGVLNLSPGTYTLTSTGLTVPESVSLIGSSPGSTILDFNSTSGKITIAGTHRYSTGTITSITSGVNVTGSGTSWLANVVAGRDSLFINGQWMVIGAVLTNTTLTLAEGYDGSTVGAGSAYRISSTINNVTLRGFNAKNSTGSVLDIDDARFIVLENMFLQDNNIGIDANYVTEFNLNLVNPISNTSHGFTYTNGGRNTMSSVNCAANGGSGVVLNSIRSATYMEGTSNSNTTDGINLTSCSDVSLKTFNANANGSNGVECVSGNSVLTIFDAEMSGNASDGLKLTATTDNCSIIAGNYQGNGGYGINIANANCDNNILVSNNTANNSSGGLNDSGTGTLKDASVNNFA